MKPIRLLLFLIPALLLVAGEKKPAPKPPQRQGSLTLPAQAQKIEPFTWQYTDAGGKVWIYRRTPFGLVRYQKKTENLTGGRNTTPGSPPLAAFDEGDKVRFEHIGPLGKSTWQRKKTELTPPERRAWERAQRRSKQDKKKGK